MSTAIESVTLEVPDPTVDGLIGTALEAGATPLKHVKKSLWGYGGVVRAPDGTIWKVATSSKKDTGPATRQVVEFEAAPARVKLALYGRRALAKDAGVSEDGSRSHRIVIGSGAGPFTDPDGFAWEAA